MGSEFCLPVFEAVIGLIGEGVIIAELEGEVVYANPSALRLLFADDAGSAERSLNHLRSLPGLKLRKRILRARIDAGESDAASRPSDRFISFTDVLQGRSGPRYLRFTTGATTAPDGRKLRIILIQDETEHHRLHALLDDSSGKPLITRNARLLEILGLLRQAGPTDAAILIEGESGTGKSLIARHIHDLSTRRARPFVEINCAALPEGLIESELFGHVRGAFTGALDGRIGRFKAANGGTLFLDEIDDLPPALQPKLLRAIQDQCFEPVGSDKTERVDVRIVAAANRGLVNLIREGAFRSDLYYRLAVIQIDIPPLRQRPGDVPLLCDHILERLAARGYPRATLSPEATQALLDYPWPGNVRELENALEHGVICARAGKIFKDGLPWHVRHGTALSNLDTVTADRDQGDRTAILEALRSARGNRSEAARLLGIDRTTLWRRMQRLGLGTDAEADG